MEHRKHLNDQIVGWITEKAKTAFPEDIALVLIYGSYINGTANEKSDVDCYYIPKTKRAYEFSKTFILEGVGYDIYPIPWERVERIASLQEGMCPLVGDVKILFCSSPEDAARFAAAQETLRQSLADDAVIADAVKKYGAYAASFCTVLQNAKTLKEARLAAGRIAMAMADIAAFYHHDYYHCGLKKQYEDLQKIPGLPASVVAHYRGVTEAKTTETVIEAAMNLFREVCAHVGIPDTLPEAEEHAPVPVAVPNASYLAGLYEEICSTFHKIYRCCKTGNAVLAFLSAVCLQRDLDQAWEEAGCPPFDLLTCFDDQNLAPLEKAARAAEEVLIRTITENGGTLKQYDSFAAFEAAHL